MLSLSHSRDSQYDSWLQQKRIVFQIIIFMDNYYLNLFPYIINKYFYFVFF